MLLLSLLDGKKGRKRVSCTPEMYLQPKQLASRVPYRLLLLDNLESLWGYGNSKFVFFAICTKIS